MMSILLFTLLSKLHCHPEIGNVSLLPVENVVVSLVRKVLPVFTKSLSNFAFVKSPKRAPLFATVGNGVMVLPAESNNVAQSTFWDPPGSTAMFPSNSKSRSCTASTAIPERAAAATSTNRVPQRFRQRPIGPISCFVKRISFLAIVASCSRSSHTTVEVAPARLTSGRSGEGTRRSAGTVVAGRNYVNATKGLVFTHRDA